MLLTNFDKAQTWRCWQNGRYFWKHIWQPYICQPNELKREIKKKLGGPSKNLGDYGPPRPPLRIVTVRCDNQYLWASRSHDFQQGLHSCLVQLQTWHFNTSYNTSLVYFNCNLKRKRNKTNQRWYASGKFARHCGNIRNANTQYTSIVICNSYEAVDTIWLDFRSLYPWHEN